MASASDQYAEWAIAVQYSHTTGCGLLRSGVAALRVLFESFVESSQLSWPRLGRVTTHPKKWYLECTMSFRKTPKGQTPKRREGLTLLEPERRQLFVADNLQVVATLEDLLVLQDDIADDIRRRD